MNLKHIKKTQCPHCGEPVVKEWITDQHCNGQNFEGVEFRCGASIEFVPNYGEERDRGECPKSKAEVERMRKRNILAENILTLVLDSDADTPFRQEILNSVWRMTDMWRDTPVLKEKPVT